MYMQYTCYMYTLPWYLGFTALQIKCFFLINRIVTWDCIPQSGVVTEAGVCAESGQTVLFQIYSLTVNYPVNIVQVGPHPL